MNPPDKICKDVVKRTMPLQSPQTVNGINIRAFAELCDYLNLCNKAIEDHDFELVREHDDCLEYKSWKSLTGQRSDPMKVEEWYEHELGLPFTPLSYTHGPGLEVAHHSYQLSELVKQQVIEIHTAVEEFEVGEKRKPKGLREKEMDILSKRAEEFLSRAKHNWPLCCGDSFTGFRK